MSEMNLLKRPLDDSALRAESKKVKYEKWTDFQIQLETCLEKKCLCEVSLGDLLLHLDPVLAGVPSPEVLCSLGFLGWLGETFHEEMVGGTVCSRIHGLVSHILKNDQFFLVILNYIKDGCEYLKYSCVQALSSLLPLSYCGQGVSISTTQIFIKKLLDQLLYAPESLNRSCAAPAASAGLGLEEDEQEAQAEEQENTLSDKILEQQSWFIRILVDFVCHGGDQKEDSVLSVPSANCKTVKLEDEVLCQEFQIKCFIVKSLEPLWEKFAKSLATITGKSAKTERGGMRLLGGGMVVTGADTYVAEGFRLWKSLLCIRANLNFVDSRNFGAHLSLPLYSLQMRTPGCIWRCVLDTVSECLCYGSTLGLQSIPPEEPCQLAHTLIRLVRFEGFLSRVPYKGYSGFGGRAVKDDTWIQDRQGRREEKEGEERRDVGYDRGMVQKIVLIILKAVALTTRESRIDSSSGESDSSLSSRESGDSCSSDLVIIERNMSGMYKQLDAWIKAVLPVLPDSKLQDNLLHVLQEQDDFLVEGLLCLLDTHLALHLPNRDYQDVYECNPISVFSKFLSIVGGDSSVLLDFLVSNETCFLLYLLRYLKFIVKDWIGFMRVSGEEYNNTVSVLLKLKQSIAKLLDKDLFPYNIGPVYKLMERVEVLVQQNKHR